MTGIDLNRAGTPLLEIVSEPDMRSAKEAVAYMKKIHTLVRYLGISDGNMQEGSFRCDANVSVRPKGQAEFGTRAELKNINSFRFVEQAINYEIERQIMVIEGGGKVVQETRLFDPQKIGNPPHALQGRGQRLPLFPRPGPAAGRDRCRLHRGGARGIARTARCQEGALHRAVRTVRLRRRRADRGTRAGRLLRGRRHGRGRAGQADRQLGDGRPVRGLNRDDLDITASPVSAQALGELLRRIDDGTISGKLAKQVFEAMWSGEGSADEVIDSKGLKQISDSSAIEGIIDEVLARSAKQIEQYRGGQEKVFGYFVGQVMKATQGKANPQQVNDLLKQKLDGS